MKNKIILRLQSIKIKIKSTVITSTGQDVSTKMSVNRKYERNQDNAIRSITDVNTQSVYLIVTF